MLAPLTQEQRVKRFGSFDWVWSPTPTNPEHIVIQHGWAEANITNVYVPQLKRHVNLNHLAVKPFMSWWERLEREGLLDELHAFNGSWVPRFIRQRGKPSLRYKKCALLAQLHRTDRLSNHAWGTAVDFGAHEYPLGKAVPPTDVRHQLAALAAEYGIGWGGNYHHRPDGMHFELVNTMR